ncbi:hypothetical protein Mal15_04160 [Stieleria maiorica]|uniref:Uncharacterized protein n=1 Tax=Stieleria maiorica TaxID=2795974 RepID=A0A5B9M5B3_9BACT|nr:hypothetical protein [Stieleria maiorica]QEF96388.1 hypothetical protein Mal15_04160 [Stieleria maiorica]
MTRNRKAIVISLAFHVCLLAVLLVWYVPRGDVALPPTAATSAADESSSPSLTSPIVDEQADLQQAEVPPPQVPPEQIRRSVDSQILATEKLSDQRKLTELERNLKRLESVANEQSVQQVSSTIAQSLGLDVDQYASKTPSGEGTFDIDTAQLSDVLRTRDESGAWQYETVMVDAQGRQMRVPTDAVGGQQLYDTFELMRRYPMARGVYQSVVMPMLQSMLEGPEQPRPSQPVEIQPAETPPTDEN